jgi:6,7-dimethyl-8-ribityllumazine synthase
MQRKEFLKDTLVGDASKLKVGIVVARFNPDITESMLAGAREVLTKWGVKDRNVKVFHVYGSFDLPFAADLMIRKEKVHAVIAIGCIVKGETDHDKHIASAAMHGLTSVSLKHGVPVSLGVLTTNNLAQARVRSRGKTNHGSKAAIAALEAALLK